ncbi:MAG: formylglycine-generating enzyme family protein [Treponema sp.]|nr:formylglycine-generating enzyme family protein [Treponema sp.]
MDYSKKGFRLPTDAEWEFAARGADPSSQVWKNEYSMTEDYGSTNSLGLVDLFLKNRFGKWYNVHSKACYDAEYVSDWLTSNMDFENFTNRLETSSYIDSDGYTWNPMYGGLCRSVRNGTSSRKMINNSNGHGKIYRLRIVRNLD